MPFVLAHMNHDQPQEAMDLCEQYSQLLMSLSGQPTEIIATANRRLGSRRLLFSSDWPRFGHDLLITRSRIEDCVQSGFMTAQDAEWILGKNAIELMQLNR